MQAQQYPEENFDLLSRELMSSSLVSEVTRVMLSAPTLERVLQGFFLGLNEIAGIQRACIYTVKSRSFELELLHSYGSDLSRLSKQRLSLEEENAPYTTAIFRNRHVIVESVSDNDPFFSFGVKSYICMPLVTRITQKCWEIRKCGKTQCPCYEGTNPYCWSVSGAGLDTGANSEAEKRRICAACSQFKCEGLLWLDTTDLENAITGSEIAHLTNLSFQAGMVMESFTMYQKVENANLDLEDSNKQLASLNCALNVAHRKIQTELDHARTIQENLLPENLPTHLFSDIATTYVPAGKVGGDYYDCFELKDNRLAIIVADVAGHGIGAALVMSMFKVLLKSLTQSLSKPSEILKQINQTFIDEVKGSNFVTAFLGLFDPKTRKFVFCSAGHNPQLLLCPDSPLEELRSDGLFVGVFEDAILKDQNIILPSSSRLILYTDGITEAQNENDEFFGLENLKQLSMGTRRLKAKESLESTVNALTLFRNRRELADDFTLVILDL